MSDLERAPVVTSMLTDHPALLSGDCCEAIPWGGHDLDLMQVRVQPEMQNTALLEFTVSRADL
jgi:hypothetical protein